MTKGEIAKKYFESGKNCSQSVALAFCDEMGLNEDLVASRMREVCGTVSGMTYVISNLYGSCGRAEVYAMVQEVAKKFEAENGSIICRVLLGLDKNVRPAPTPDARTREYYKKRPCSELCKTAADILDEFIKSQSNCK